MQMIKNAKALAGVCTHTHTGNLKTERIKYKSNQNKPIKI